MLGGEFLELLEILLPELPDFTILGVADTVASFGVKGAAHGVKGVVAVGSRWCGLLAQNGC